MSTMRRSAAGAGKIPVLTMPSTQPARLLANRAVLVRGTAPAPRGFTPTKATPKPLEGMNPEGPGPSLTAERPGPPGPPKSAADERRCSNQLAGGRPAVKDLRSASQTALGGSTPKSKAKEPPNESRSPG
jgi:hypothetical protein